MILDRWANEYVFCLWEAKRRVSLYPTVIWGRFLVLMSELVWPLQCRQLIQENNVISQGVATIPMTNTSIFYLKKKRNSHTLVCWVPIILQVRAFTIIALLLASHLPTCLLISFHLQESLQRCECRCKSLFQKLKGLN